MPVKAAEGSSSLRRASISRSILVPDGVVLGCGGGLNRDAGRTFGSGVSTWDHTFSMLNLRAGSDGADSVVAEVDLASVDVAGG